MSVVGRQRLPVVTYLGHTSRALSFYGLDDIYLAIGKTSAWQDDETTNENFIPPEPQLEDTELMELVGMKKLTRKCLVMPDDNGTIQYRNTTWKVISEEEAIANQARWVYVECCVYFDELPLVDYRQIGIFSRVQKADNVSVSQTVLLPEDIKSVGLLEVIDNRHVVTRQVDTKDVYSMIIEF